MAVDAIDKWLQNPEFTSGVKIYRQFGKNAARLMFYEQKVYKLPALIKDIQAIRDTLNISTGNITSAKKEAFPAASVFKKENKKLPVHILEIKKAGDKAWKEARNLQSTILQQRSKKRRAEMAKRILELVPFAFEQWRNVDEYEKTGSLSFLLGKEKKEKSVNTMTLLELVAASKNIPGYITKFKNQLQNAKTKEKTDYLKKMLAEKESDYSAVNGRLEYLNQKIIELCL